MQAVRKGKVRFHCWLKMIAFLLAVGILLSLCVSARAGKAAPTGTSLKRLSPAEKSCFPLESQVWRKSDAYGWRNDPFTGKETFHQGVDLACVEGTLVLAAMSGVVVSARSSASYGNVVRICHREGQETIYAHMQYLFVRAGEIVQAGQAIGTVGHTGRATGAHLHLELYQRGVVYDPEKLLK